ncbi:helix-turn-helix domain-containing protein [Priestia endophytica]|uniref:helix-turn-helix domain-containing protein n=1 Tax=Priestia endophytica TaxID=135735 RepID=UPI00227F406F|nr:helix-turn-helix transcriptional regulator [Priestia endophytica]MCY8231593.1 helix-turn-helix domain-containing protein [Priestia endophytica]
MNTIGQNIRFQREQKGMSQEELALKIRVGTSTIQKYESGQSLPDTQTILKISTALDIPAAELTSRPTVRQLVFPDAELTQLVNEIGVERTKRLLQKIKGYSDDQFLAIMNTLFYEKDLLIEEG